MEKNIDKGKRKAGKIKGPNLKKSNIHYFYYKLLTKHSPDAGPVLEHFGVQFQKALKALNGLGCQFST